MYIKFMESEVKKWLRDPLMRFMLVYPILFGFIGRYFVPWIGDYSALPLEAFEDLIIAVLTLLTPQLYGALIGFSILEDRDDHILTAIRVTPLSLDGFLGLRIGMVFVLSWLANIYVMVFSNIGNLTLTETIIISFLAALSAPMIGLLINGLAHNKIEGFAVMKGLGVLIILPIIALFFFDVKELFFAIAPGFWPAKAISSLIRGEGALYLNYSQYLLIGFAYLAVLNGLTYKMIKRKIAT